MYLADKIDIIELNEIVKQHGSKIMILAGVGAGKSTWVKEVLAKDGNVLFITSRRAKVDEDINNSDFKNYINKETLLNSHQTLVTNAKIHSFIKNVMIETDKSSLDEFLSNYKYVVVDEVHSIASDASFSESAFGLLCFIEYAVEYANNHDCIVITMTGTPEPVLNYFHTKKWYILDLRDECTCVYPQAIYTIQRRYLRKKIKEILGNNNQIIYFVTHASYIPHICKELLNEKIVLSSEVAVVVSDGKEDDVKEKCFAELGKEKTDEIFENSKKCYESIVSAQHLPYECQILFSTSRLKEGIDIHNSNVVAICESHVLTDLIQYYGRIRASGGTVYVVSDSKQHVINTNEIIYNYAHYECITANIFSHKNALELDNGKNILKAHVCKNPYIYYNYIEKQFEVFEIKYNEEKRIRNCYGVWKEQLYEYCNKNGIRTTIQLDYRKRQIGST